MDISGGECISGGDHHATADGVRCVGDVGDMGPGAEGGTEETSGSDDSDAQEEVLHGVNEEKKVTTVLGYNAYARLS